MYRPNNYRIGKTPEWWARFEAHQNSKARACGGSGYLGVNFVGFSTYDTTTGEAVSRDGSHYFPLRDVPHHQDFFKRNGSFEGIPIFGREMRNNINAWARDYGTFLGKGAPFFRVSGVDQKPEYHFPEVDDDRNLEILYAPHTVTAFQNDFPDPKEHFPKDGDPRFGMHCVFDWFLIVGAWLNTLERVWAVVSPVHEMPFDDGGFIDEAYTSNGLDGEKNDGSEPIWVNIDPDNFQPDDPRYDFDSGGALWYSGMPQFASAGINYAKKLNRNGYLTIAISQSGQLDSANGKYIQTGLFAYPPNDAEGPKATAYIPWKSNGGVVRRYHPHWGFIRGEVSAAGAKIQSGSLLRFSDIGEFKNGKWIGFSFGRRFYSVGGHSVVVHSFDGWDGKLMVDGKEFSAKAGRDLYDEDKQAWTGTLFYVDAELDETKKEWPFELKAENLTLPSDVGGGGWEGGFTFLHGIFELDLASKLEPLE